MLLSNILPVCLLYIQLIECLTPAGLKALALINNQKAMAAINAINLRAKAQYNAALARSLASSVGHLDRRVIRDSNVNLLGQERYEFDPVADQAGNEYYDKDNLGVDSHQFVTPSPQQTEFDSYGGGNAENDDAKSEYSCVFEEVEDELRPEDLPQISVNFNEDYQSPTPSPNQPGCSECQATMSQQANGFPQGGAKSADAHIHSHSPFHNHFHPHRLPTTHVVTPGVNLHITQNQNAVVHQSELSGTPVLNPVPVLHTSGRGVPHDKHIEVNVNSAFGHGYIPASHSSTIYPKQFDKTPVMTSGGHIVSGAGVGGNSVVQTQSVHQGIRGSEAPDNVGMVAGPVADDIVAHGVLDDDKLGHIFTTSRMRSPKYDEYSDPRKPQYHQEIVKYLDNHKAMPLPNGKHDQKIVHPSYYNPGQFLNPGKVRLADPNFGNDRLGTFMVDPREMEPIPMLPEDFAELDSSQRQKVFTNILETEHRNVERIFEQIEHSQRNSMHNLERLMDDTHRTHADNIQDEFQHIYEPMHFQDVHHVDTSPSPIDVPQPLGDPRQPLFQNWERESMPKFIETGPAAQGRSNMLPEDDSTLGNLFQMPERRLSDDYHRLARSLNRSRLEEFDKLLLKEREVINALKKNAKHDEDLMMIGYIGDSILNDFEQRMNKIKRSKRQIGQSLPINRLITDPKVRLDVPKTMENLGVAAKTAFEHERAPLYHVRNMLGSAQDAVMASMKIPTQNVLIPSQYKIVNAQGQRDTVGAINPNLFSSNHDGEVNDGIIQTFNKVGSAVRGSVLSGQEALGHVGQMASHARSAIHSGRYATPRMILRQVPHVTREPTREAVIIAPRILHISEDNGRVGSALSKPQPDFVGVGHIFDAVGVSNPNVNNVELEKIVIRPRTKFLAPGDFDSQQRISVRSFQDPIEGVSLVPQELIHPFMGQISDSQMRQGDFPRNSGMFEARSGDVQTADGPRVGESQIRRGDFTGTHVDSGMFEARSGDFQNADGPRVGENLGEILGAINPMMFEKIFNESFRIKNETESPHAMFHQRHHRQHEEDNLGTSMTLTNEMMSPFMGYASKKMQEEFFRKYTPGVNADNSQYIDFEGVAEAPQWADILQPYQQNESGYKD